MLNVRSTTACDKRGDLLLSEQAAPSFIAGTQPWSGGVCLEASAPPAVSGEAGGWVGVGVWEVRGGLLRWYFLR